MKIRPFNHNVSILAVEKENKKYAGTYAWFMQVGEKEIAGLLGEQSVTANILSIGDIVGISVCSKEMFELSAFIGDTHSNEIDKFAGKNYTILENKAILFNDAKCKMVCEVVDILHLKNIESDNLVYFQILEYKMNDEKEYLSMSDFR